MPLPVPLSGPRFLWIAAALASCLAVALAGAAPAQAITQKQAAKRALAALGSEKRAQPVIVFGLPKPITAGSKITQAGTTKPTRGGTKGLTKRLREAGVTTVKAPHVLTVGREPAYFFYEDQAPFQLYQHAGRVALVGATSGRVTLSRIILWPPLIDGKLPAFLKSAGAYRSSKYRVLYIPWTGQAKPRVSNRNLLDEDPFGPGKPLPEIPNAKQIADYLAAEHSCALRVSDTLPAFWDVNAMDLTRTYLGTLFELFERANPAFIDERYGARSGESLAQAVNALVVRGCRDIILYLAGSGYSTSSQVTVQLGTNPRPGGLIARNELTAEQIQSLVETYAAGNSGGLPTVTFKVYVDAPYAGGLVNDLDDLENVRSVQTASGPGQPGFAFIPDILSGGGPVSAQDNPGGMFEFTNALLHGLVELVNSPAEIDKCGQVQNQGGSFLACFVARAQELGQGTGFASQLGAVPKQFLAPGNDSDDANRAPKADAQSVSATEDTPKTIVLTGSDPDGNALTFSVGSGPVHGTLSGTAPNLTYTPDANFAGTDSFTFTVADGRGGTSTATVSITVTPANDAPVVTASAGSTAYIEQNPKVVVDGGLTVADIDDTNLESATVQVLSAQAADSLSVTPQLGISGTYNSGTGVLLLTGPSGGASKSDWQQVLRDVKYEHTGDNPAASKTIEFKVNDGDADSAAATKGIAVTGVNDAPSVAIANPAFTYNENAGAVVFDPTATPSDPDSPQLNRALVTLSGALAQDTLAATPPAGITGSYNPGNGVLTLSGDAPVADYQSALRSVTYSNSSDTPTTATRTISVEVRDTGNLSSPADTRNITVSPSDDGPIAVNDSVTFNEDSSNNAIDVLANDTDVDGGPKFVHLASQPENGTIVITGPPGARDGIQYTPDPDYCNEPGAAPTDDFNYTVSPGDDPAVVSVTVNCAPDAPVANDDTRIVDEDSGDTNFTVLSNDTDADTGDTINITNVTDPANGTATIAGGSPDTIKYTPDPNYCNDPGAAPDDTFTYTVNGGDTATVSVKVTCVDDPPVANDDSRTVTEDSLATAGSNQFDVLTNDSDIESDAIQITAVSDPANGTAAVIDGSPDKVSYQPDANYCNDPGAAPDDTFTYTVNGGDTATVSVKVSCVDDPPVANDDSRTVAEDDPLTNFTVLSNDTDLENDAIEITAVDDTGTNGTIAIVQGTPDQVSYTPDPDYCNDPGPAPDDTFTYTVNGGDTATVSVKVTCSPDNPVANDDARTVAEDSLATAGSNQFDVLTNDTDADGDAIEVTAVTPGAGTFGTVAVVEGTPDKVSYQPNAQYCNNPPGTTLATFTYTVTGGDTATVTVTVTCSNDAPTAVDDTGTTTEDATLNAVAPGVLTNDTDPDTSDTKTVTKLNGSATLTQSFSNGRSLTINADGSYSFDPGTHYQSLTTAGSDNTFTFTYTMKDGANVEDEGSVTITVTGLNDAPVVDLDNTAGGNNNTVTFLEPSTPGAGNPVTLAPNAETSDVDDANLESATITLTNRPNGSAESLSATVPGGNPITITPYNSSNGELKLNGPATKAQFDAVLRSVTYNNTAAPPDPANRVVEFKANDGEADSAIATSTVTVVPFNLPPVTDLNGTGTPLFDTTATFTEGTAATLAQSTDLTDGDDTHLDAATIKLASAPDGSLESLTAAAVGGVVVTAYNPTTRELLLSGHQEIQDYEDVLRSVQYNNTSENPTATNRSITFKVNDGQADSNTATVDLTVNAVNDRPVVDLNAGSPGIDSSAGFTEDLGAVTLSMFTTVTDVDNANLQSAEIKITNVLDPTFETLAVNVGATGIVPSYDSGSGTLTLTKAGGAPVADWQSVLQTATYNNTDQDPNTTSRVITYKVNDGTLENLPLAQMTVTVSASNDAPSVDLNGGGVGIDNSGVAFVEDSAPANPGSGAVAIAPSALTADVDNANLASATATLTNHPDGAAESLSATVPGGNPITITAYNATTGELKLNGPATKAQFDAVIQSIKYNNTSNTPNTTNRDITVTVTDGALTSPVAHSSVTVTATNDAPTVGADTVNGAVHNTSFVVDDPTDGAPTVAGPKKSVTGDVLANDSDPESSPVSVVNNDSIATANGGTVDIDPDGDFVYLSDPTDNCSPNSDSFSYSVTDGDLTTQGTVTLGSIAGCVWYVDNDPATAGNAGTSKQPFDALSSADAKTANGQTTYVFKGTSDYTLGYSLEPNERLVGEAQSLSVNGATHAGGGDAKRPTITDAADDVVVLDDANTVTGLKLDPQGGGGIAGGSGDGSGTIADVKVTDAGVLAIQPGLELDSTSGTWDISDLIVSNGDGSAVTSTDVGVRLNTSATVNFASTGLNKITTSSAKAFDATSANMGTGSVIDETTVTGSGSGGVRMSGTTGTTTFGHGSGSDFDVTTASGATAALDLSSAGTVTINGGGAGAQKVHATGGPAVDVQNTPAVMSFDEVSSTNSANDGVNLDGLGAGTFHADTGANTFITGATGIGFDVNGGNGSIDFDDIQDGSGTTAEITGRTGGSVTINGQIADGADAGGGITIGGAAGLANTGGSTTFSNASKTLDTGASHAIEITNSAGHSTTLSGGGLNADTSTGRVLNLDNNPGNVTVSGSGNSVDASGSGTAIHVDDGAGTVSINAAAETGTGQVATVQNRDAGSSVTLSGTMTDSGTSTGIDVTSNAGTVTFSGPDSNLTTATNNGIDLATNTGTVNFTGGNLDIAATSGTGFEATGGGTVTVTGSGNSIATGSGQALSVDGVTIGDNDLVFESIASNGASNGISLSATSNANGRLTVTGNGGTCTSNASCTGGAIRNSSGPGIALASVPGGVSLTRMAVTHDAAGGDDGIQANGVGTSNTANGVALDNLFVSTNGDVAAERGLDMTNVLGQSTISSTTVTASAEENARINNTSGRLDLKVTGSTFSLPAPATGSDGLQIVGGGTATILASVTGSTFSGNRDDGFQLGTSGSTTATMDITFNNNTVVASGNPNQAPANAGVTISPGSASTTRFSMSGGSIKGSDGAALILNPAATSTFHGTVDGIAVGDASSLAGSKNAMGIWAKPTQNPTSRIAIKNSTIQHYKTNGIYAYLNDGTTGNAHFIITGNTINNPEPGFEGLLVEAGGLSSDTETVCAEIGGAGAFANNLSTAGGSGLEDIKLTKYLNSTFILPGLTDNSTAGIQSYLVGRNSGNGAPVATWETQGGTAPALNQGGCTTPTAATPPQP